MLKLVLLSAVLMTGGMASAQNAPASAAHSATDIAGDWQGTLKLPSTSLRIVVRFAKGDKGLTMKFFSIDQAGAPPLNATTVSQEGNAVKFTIELAGATYTGTLNADGSVIAGNWSQGGQGLPLDFVRATKETAWEIPAPVAPPKQMAADANPSFDVATIKPSDPSITSMQGLVVSGRNFKTRGSSAGDLICFAYDVQMKQIVGAPDWLNKDRYDLDAVPDVEGIPSPVQLRLMVRKLLADRYKLTFHKEKRDMSAYVLTVAKSGSKLKETEVKGPLPGLFFRPAPGGIAFGMVNGTMADLASFLQSLVLDRPVVDQTGLTARYDLSVKFMPDESQFNGHPPQVPKNDAVEQAPSLFDAMQKDGGLKLDAQKTAVEVIAIDHLEKASAN